MDVKEFIFNFTNEFSDSFLYAYVLQIILISYMYSCVGNGRYWKILLVGSLFGMFAAVTEHLGTAWLKTVEGSEENMKGSKGLYCYMLAEVGWIASEFSIPYLNLIKLNTLSQSKIIKTINHTIALLFFFFAGFRLYIGYLRVSHGVLFDETIYRAHGIAFGIMAVADGILSIIICLRLNKSAKISKEEDGDSETINILKLFKKSSLFILFVVDLMSVVLAILSIFIGIPSLRESLSKLIKPFHALKSNFILVLAIDAFVFKMRASIDGTNILIRYQKRQPPSNVGGDNDFNKRNKNIPMPSMTNSVATSVSAMTANNSNTPIFGTQKKQKSILKKNCDETDSPCHRINMENIDIGIVNSMMVDVYGVEKHEADKKYGKDKHGKDKQGNDKQGNDKQGYDRQGYDKQGNDKQGNEKYRNEKYGDEKFGSEKYRNDKYGDEKYGNEKHRNEKFGSEKYRNDKYGDEKYGNEKHRNEKYRDEKYRNDKYGDEKYRNGKYGDDKYGSEKYRNEKYGDEKYGSEKYRNEKHRDERYRNDKYGDEKYGDEKYGSEKYRNEKYGNEKHYGAEKYVNEKRYSSSSSTVSNGSLFGSRKKKVLRSSQINVPLPQNPIIIKPMKSFSPSMSPPSSPSFNQNNLISNENQSNSNKTDKFSTRI